MLSFLCLATSCENRSFNHVTPKLFPNCTSILQVHFDHVPESIFSPRHFLLFRRKERSYLVVWVPQDVKKYKSSSCLSSTLQTFNDTLIILISSYGLSSFGFVFTVLMACATSIPLITRPNTVCLLSSHGCHEKIKAD